MNKDNLELAGHLMVKFLDGWRIDQRFYDDRFIRLIGSNGKLIVLSNNWRDKNKIKACRAIYSKKKHLSFERFGGDIGFSLNRSPQAHAREIKRRLLNNYDYMHKEFTDKAKDHDLKQLSKVERVNSFLHANNKLECSNSYSYHRFIGDVFSFKKEVKTRITLEANLARSFRTEKNVINISLGELPEALAYRILNEVYQYIDKGENDNE